MSRIKVPISFTTALLSLLGTDRASAQADFPFVPFVATLDFSEPDSVAEFEALVDEVGRHSLVYIDWHVRHGALTEVFDLLEGTGLEGAGADGTGAEEDLDPEQCERLSEALAAGTGRIELGGRPNPENNHLIFGMLVRISEEDPFAIARCEYAGTGYAPRIRGFFYVTEDRIATAEQFDLRPVLVDAAQIPAGFFPTSEP